MNGLALVIGVIVVLGLLLMSYSYGTKSCELSLIRGFWEADRSFCDEAGLQLFSMYIGRRKSGVYPCYLLMVDTDDTILINEAACFSLKEPITNMVSTDDCREFYADFTNLETDLMPCRVILKYYPSTGKIVFSDNDKIYAVLFKNPVLSEMERISKEKPDAAGMADLAHSDSAYSDAECL
jgi:hypothetical protein